MVRAHLRKANSELNAVGDDLRRTLKIDMLNRRALRHFANWVSHSGAFRASYDATDEILALCDGVLAKDSSRADAHLLRAEAHEQQITWRQTDVLIGKQDWATVLSDYADAIRLDPTLVEAYRGRSQALQRAIPWAEVMATIGTNTSTTALECANSLEQAIADMDACIRLEPNNDLHYFDRAVLHSNLNSLQNRRDTAERVLADYRRAIELSPENSIYHLMRSFLWRYERNYEQALRDLEHAQRLHSESMSRWPNLNLADFLATCPDARFRDGHRALELAQEASKLPFPMLPHDEQGTYRVVAAAHAELGDFDEAVTWQTKIPHDWISAEDTIRLEHYKGKKPYRMSESD